MDTINIFNVFITIISFIINIFFIIPFIVKIFDYFLDKRFIKKVLNFSKGPVQIYPSTYALQANLNKTYTFISYEFLKSLNNISKILQSTRQKYNIVDVNLDTISKDEINIGGFITNKKVNVYFSTHFKNFKFISDIKYKEEHDTYTIDKSMIEYDTKDFGFRMNNNKDCFLETNDRNDYAFLIKLVNSDFKDDYNRCVHILFGGGSIGTIKAAEYLSTHYKQIYKKFRNNHYFFAIEVSRIDGSINHARGIIDLTDIMFDKDTNDDPTYVTPLDKGD